MYFLGCLLLWQCANGLGRPTPNHRNDDKNNNHPYHFKPSSWENSQPNEYAMTYDLNYNNKMASFWAFLIGLLTAFGLMLTVWIIVYRARYANKRENDRCGCANNKKNSVQFTATSVNRHVRMNKYAKCKARRHKHHYCTLHRTRLKS